MPKKNKRTDVFKNIDMSSGLQDEHCWPWTAGLRKGKLGELRPIFKCEGDEWYAYRLVWVLYNGRELLPNEVIRHKCDNSTCCNPMHLLVGTQKENVIDVRMRERQGHKIIDVKKAMQMLEIGCTSDFVAQYMKKERGISMDASVVRRIKRREYYAHIEWEWGDTWAAANRARLDSMAARGILDKSTEEGDDDVD